MTGICPHCDKMLSRLNVNGFDAFDSANVNGTWKAVTFTCPWCRKVLGTGFDQRVLPQAIAEEIMRRLPPRR